MAEIVVDTDVVSFLFKNDSRADLYRSHLDGHIHIISFMTVAELSYWVQVKNWGEARRLKMTEHLRRFAVHPYDSELCNAWAEVKYSARKNGKPISSEDAWVAAVALRHGLPLVTHNRADYVGVNDLELISESKSE